MVKVLCITNIPPGAPCGVVTYYKNLHKNFLNDPEIDMHLLTIHDASSLGKKIAGLVRRVILLFSFKNKRMIKLSIDTNYRVLILSALKAQKNKEYDIIHAQDILSGYAAKLFYKRKLPLILTCHFNDNPVEEEILRYNFSSDDKKYLVNMYKNSFHEVDNLIYHSKYSYDKSKHLINKSSDFKVIHNGVYFPNFHTGKTDTGILQIINVGFVEPRKNQTILIDVANELIREKIYFHITLVGAGPDVPVLKKLISENNLDSYFTFTGWSKKVDEHLKKADLYIHTSVNDICPYSILEAISKNVPAIAFNVGGIPEMLDDEYLFKLNDFRSMAEFIVENRTNLGKIAVKQFNKIADVFSIENQFKKTKDLYLLVGTKNRKLVKADKYTFQNSEHYN